MGGVLVLFVWVSRVIDCRERGVVTTRVVSVHALNFGERTHITRVEGNDRRRPSHPAPQGKIHQILHHCRLARIPRSEHHQPRSCLVLPLALSAAIEMWRLSACPACSDGPACEYAPTFKCEMEVGEEWEGG